jgi:hypothetical protein
MMPLLLFIFIICAFARGEQIFDWLCDKTPFGPALVAFLNATIVALVLNFFGKLGPMSGFVCMVIGWIAMRLLFMRDTIERRLLQKLTGR